MVLDKIQKENDIKKLTDTELAELATEIRNFLVENISQTGGHLASNLGVVELTMALHLAFDLPKDKIIWDVGHQSYTHKILTGRKDGFNNLRQYGVFLRRRRVTAIPLIQGTAPHPYQLDWDLPRRERLPERITMWYLS